MTLVGCRYWRALDVGGPHLVRCVDLRRVPGGTRPESFASASLRHAQPFLAPQPLDLFVVDVPPRASWYAGRNPRRRWSSRTGAASSAAQRPGRPRCCPQPLVTALFGSARSTQQVNPSLTFIVAMRR